MSKIQDQKCALGQSEGEHDRLMTTRTHRKFLSPLSHPRLTRTPALVGGVQGGITHPVLLADHFCAVLSLLMSTSFAQ